MLMEGEEQHIKWYRRVLLTKGISIIWAAPGIIKPGDRIATYTARNYARLGSLFYIHSVGEVHGVTISAIDSIKQSA